MTTETDLRTALRARAADAPTVDPDDLLATLAHQAPPTRSTAGTSHGRRWAIAGVAAGFAAIAVTSGVLVSTDRPPAPAGAGASPAAPGAASVDARTQTAEAAARAAAAQRAAAAAASAAAAAANSTTNPYDPAAPAPLDSSWLDTANDPSVDVDDSAIVFSDDPVVAFYVKPHQQLSILPGGGTRKDSSDAPWHTAVQVLLPGSGFDPSSMGAPTPVTVNGVAGRFGTLPKLLDVPGAAAVPSLLWQVGAAWVVLQIDTPASPSQAQLAAAAARVDVHHG